MSCLYRAGVSITQKLSQCIDICVQALAFGRPVEASACRACASVRNVITMVSNY